MLVLGTWQFSFNTNTVKSNAPETRRKQPVSGKVTEWHTETRRKMPTCFPFDVFICLISHSAQSWGETGNGLYRRPSHPYRMKAVLASSHMKFLILFISCCPIMVSRPWDVQERVWNRSQESAVCSWYYLHNSDKSPFHILFLPGKKEGRIPSLPTLLDCFGNQIW